MDRVMMHFSQFDKVDVKKPVMTESVHESNGMGKKFGQSIKATPLYKELTADYGYEEAVVLAAFKFHHSKPKLANEIDVYSKWCEENMGDQDRIEEILEQEDQETEVEIKQPKSQDNNDKVQVVADDNDIKGKLYSAYNKFFSNINDIDATDYINFEKLATGLQSLMQQYGTKPERNFPEYMKLGQPNLIVCSEKEMHKIAISLYYDKDNKPLPGLDEVLVCSSNTPAEQVELICRRAFNDTSGKIFTVMHAQHLSYDKSIGIEELFLNKFENNQYRIVFIASKEENKHAYIVTALAKNAIQAQNPLPLEVLSEYMSKKLNTAIVEGKAADPDKSRFSILLSNAPGNGKTLLARRLAEQNSKSHSLKTFQVLDETVNVAEIIQAWSRTNIPLGTAYHIDIAGNVEHGIQDLMFSLAVLGGLMDHSGNLWLCYDADFYLMEMTKSAGKQDMEIWLPKIVCESPRNVLRILQELPESQKEVVEVDRIFRKLLDMKTFGSATFQRPFRYLSLHQQGSATLENFTYSESIKQELTSSSLKTLLDCCPVEDPSWNELTNFASFLNIQLDTTERSIFCNANLMGNDLPGFKSFMVRFLIRMSQDFASRSIHISDESQGGQYSKPVIMHKRQWEKSPHPYVFFNEDGQTISFFGVHIQNLNLVAEQNGITLEQSIMSKRLYDALLLQKVEFNKGLNTMSRQEKLQNICQVLGIKYNDPDATFELTYDNVMKMLAIQMRFRCNIPVVIMGETGCGKTRLIRFMCELQNERKGVPNMLILKCHGDITAESILLKVNEAIKQARENIKCGIKQTIMFFDEANTTSAIATIKTVMCDFMINGNPIPRDIGLQFVAAVNPYREHSKDMIKKLENAGLGYHIKSEKTTDRTMKIPMRCLVYRVKELPASMFPLVWDFGTLDAKTEEIYISQLIKQEIEKRQSWPCDAAGILLSALTKSQEFMRKMKDECSFVSLRDVERTLDVLKWFHSLKNIILDKLAGFANMDPFAISLVLALGVTYYIRLDNRKLYETEISNVFQRNRYDLKDNFSKIIEACQNIFIAELRLGSNIAKNGALKENIWIMVICIELRIPLFLVGKPGSSKSLAKTVVTTAMQGTNSSSNLFKHFKEIHMVSFQCSPLATAGGILGAFRQCQQFQKKRDLSKFVSVVVLDEIGLAEDSPKMALKALHPLLEDGCIDDEKVKKSKKVAFVGISNWALDPAKMNRGILVSRGKPEKAELMQTAIGICANDEDRKHLMQKSISLLTDGYYHIYEHQDREYFGLRDFYSMVKMIFAIAQDENRSPTDRDIQLTVQRNFGGFYGDFDPVGEFMKAIGSNLEVEGRVPAKDLIMNAVRNDCCDSRYILLLTKNNVALQIIQSEKLLNISKTLIIFGSSFPHDQEYTKICFNINRIKIAMELGQTVVLCNLRSLYESLYDALNQNYVIWNGRRYIDLGLGTQRVKCRVHENFRLVVVAEDTEVHQKFPIPLLNRLEKHFLGMETMLTANQKQHVIWLKRWVHSFCQVGKFQSKDAEQYSPADVFIGYHDDLVASLVFQSQEEDENEVEEAIKCLLLRSATPDAISRLDETTLPRTEQDRIFEVYHRQQEHTCLSKFIMNVSGEHNFLQVTTSSRLLTKTEQKILARELGVREKQLTVLSLQQIDTEEQFTKLVKKFMQRDRESNEYLLIQAEVTQSAESVNLVECSRYIVQDLMRAASTSCRFQVVFVLHVPRVRGGCLTGIPVHPWISCHIDELRTSVEQQQDISKLKNETVASMFQKNLVNLEQMIVECLPRALSLTQGTDPSRMQECIKILLSSSDKEEAINETRREFVTVLRKVIIAAVTAVQTDPDPRAWLVKLAVTSKHLKEGNTFRKAIWLHLSEIVKPILSDIIRFCDVDYGLNFIAHSSAELRKVFLLLLERSYAKGLVQKQDNSFQCNFPFSRFITNLVEKYKDQKETSDISAAELQAILETTNFNDTFKQCFEFGIETLRPYLIDFVYLLFPIMLQADAKDFICQQLFHLAKNEMEFRKAINIAADRHSYISLADVHVAFSRNKARLNLLATLFNFKPQLPKMMPESSSRQSAVVDIMAFLEAVKLLEPRDNLVSEQIRTQLCNDIHKICSLYPVLAKLHSDNQDLSELKTQLESDVRRLTIIKLFLKYVCKGSPEVIGIICAKMKRLNVVLNGNRLKTGEEFDKLLKFLYFLNEEVGKHHFNQGQDTCIVCKEDLTHPVALPCKHVGCAKCLQEYFFSRPEDGSICPVENCKTDVPKSFKLQSTPVSQEKVKSHQNFKQTLNTFFMDILQKFVFKGTQEPDEKVIEALMSFIVTKELPKDLLNKNVRTKPLSPFSGHCIDSTPVIRSFILQLLLSQFNVAFKYLHEYLENERKRFAPEPPQFLELCLLITICLEDYAWKEDPGIIIGQHETVSLERSLNFIRNCDLEKAYKSLAESLSHVANARLAIITIAAALHQCIATRGAVDKKVKDFLGMAEVAVNKNPKAEQFKNFLIRSLVSMFRKDLILEWKQSGEFKRLMTDKLITASWTECRDNYLVRRGRYKEVRDALKQSLATDEYEGLLRTLETFHRVETEWSLSLYFLQMLECKNLDKLTRTIEKRFPSLAAIARSHQVDATDGLRRLFPAQNCREQSVLSLLHHIRTVFKFSRVENPITNPLYLISTNPGSAPYLPTMPQDETMDVKNAVKNAVTNTRATPVMWYKCPNGHPYSIGECGRPMAVGTCNECKAPIGGTGHTFVNNQAAGVYNVTDETKTGHILGQPTPNQPSMADRGLSGLHVALTRFIVHAAMALSCLVNPEHARVIIQPTVAQVPHFLMSHMLLNLQQIAKQLGRNEDDAQVLLHRIIHNLSTKVIPANAQCNLNSRQGRQVWEGLFAKEILDPEVTTLTENVARLSEILKREQTAAESTLEQILGERANNTFHLSEVLNQPHFWIPRERISIHSIAQKVTAERLNTSCPNFSRLMKGELVLSEMIHLPSILRMHSIISKKFAYKVESFVINDMTIRSFIYEKNYFVDPLEREEMKTIIYTFLDTFNLLKGELLKCGIFGRRALDAAKNSNLTADSPAGVLFPSVHELGQCSVALVRLLIIEHNSMIRRHAEESGLGENEGPEHNEEDARLLMPVVSPMVVSVEQLVRFDQKELHLLLLANSEYSLEVGRAGQQTQWRLNELGLERDVTERFIFGRPLINEEAIPEFHFQNDQLKKVQLAEVIPQRKLPRQVCNRLDSHLRDLVEVCDYLAIAETTRDFVLVTGGSEDEPVAERMQKLHLNLPPECRQTLDTITLTELDHLVELLQLIRARRMVLNKHDPFSQFAPEFRMEIDNKIIDDAMNKLMKGVAHDALLAKLHGFIVRRLDVSESVGVFADFMAYHLQEEEEDELAEEFSAALDRTLTNGHVIDLFVQLVRRIQSQN